MKKLVIALVLLVAVVGAVIGVRVWRGHVAHAGEERAFQRAQSFLAGRRPLEALALFESHGNQPDATQPWADIEFRALVLQVNLPRLTAIFQRDPDRVLKDEEGSLAVGRAFLHLRQAEAFEKARGAWRGKETRADRWLLLDADRLMLSGDRIGAELLLGKSSFPGTNDVPRLLRLALLAASHDAPRSFALLNQAAALNPRAADARSFRGQVLEALGRTEEARVEYVAAVVAEPANPLWRDQLAEYYRRRHAYDLAMATLRDGLASPSLDVIWLKAGFWERMVQPLDPASQTNTPPQGALSPLVQLVRELPRDRFFDTNAFAALPSLTRVARDRQEVRWLRIAELLRLGDEKGAAGILGGPRTSGTPWEPDLERALLRILAWRASPATNRSAVPHGLDLPAGDRTPADLPGFFAHMESLAAPDAGGTPPADLARVLEGPHAFAAAFLAAGWREAALRLAPIPASDDLPDWLAYAYAQALRRNRGADATLAFLRTQRPPRPLLELVSGEVLLASGKTREGMERLGPLARDPSDPGYRAAWLLAVAALDQGQPDGARAAVSGQPRLATNVTGREILARAALAEGKTNDAERLYQAVATNSVEARMYFARQAYTRADWPRARELTLELLAEMPDRLELRANLEAIAAAEKKGRSNP